MERGGLSCLARTAQYTMIAIGVSLTLGGTLRFLVTPKIVATFEALAVALKR